MVAADTDSDRDIYERSDGATTLVSAPGVGATGPSADATHPGISKDGTHVFFQTTERLVGADTDGLQDIYERSGGTTTLVSVPAPGGGDMPAPVYLMDVSTDGGKAFLWTGEDLVAADTDGTWDVYERSAGTTTLVSAPGAGASGPPERADFGRASADGTKVFFETDENLVASDTDGLSDVYERSDGTTKLVSVPGEGASGPAAGAFFPIGRGSASEDGAKVFFETNESLVGSDTDGRRDIYEHSGGTTTLISVPGEGASGPASDVMFIRASDDGSRVFFETNGSLVAADTGDRDFYERSAGTTSLVTAPGAGAGEPPPRATDPFSIGASSDGSRFFFYTARRLVGADTDEFYDIYERSGGNTTLVSVPGPGASGPEEDIDSGGPSDDGTKFFFNTSENLVASDTDGLSDVYERSDGTTKLVSVPGEGASGPPAHAFIGINGGWSPDGAKAFFQTSENLVAADRDGLPDLYQRAGGVTTLVSAEEGPPLGVPPRATITSGPSGEIHDATPTFRFSVNEPGSSFECRFDSASFGPCSGPGSSHSPTGELSEGPHTFEVRAIDPAGNTSVPVSRSFELVLLRCFGKVATIVGGYGSNTIVGTTGRDVIVARGGGDAVHGRSGRDVICGGRGGDDIWGGRGGDDIRGGRGADSLFGQTGRDTLTGGPGLDVLRGGSGPDRAVQ